MSDLAEISSKIECRKIAMRQTDKGHVISLLVHPDDMPENLFRDPVGQRYMAVLVRLNDQDEPVADPQTEEGIKAVTAAGALCADPRFQGWLVINDIAEEASEEAAAAALRIECRVTSRKEFRVNQEARQRFFALRDQFVADLRRS